MQFAGLSLGASLAKPFPIQGKAPLGLGRVTVDWIGLYPEPAFASGLREKIFRDELITLLEHVRSDEGPKHNPAWYRVTEGYIHSGHVQNVKWNPQDPEQSLPQNGALFETSVPFTRAYLKPDPRSKPAYRLYYASTVWVQDVVLDETGQSWYGVFDDLLRIKYYVRSKHFRRVSSFELTPLSPDIPQENKRIEVSLATQELFCYEKNELVLRTLISSGMPRTTPSANGIPTVTPEGRFFVEVKMPSRHMGDGELTADIFAYELPGVPWVSFFTSTGVAFHGVYWHNDFGRKKSHGCVNMRADEAKWLYRWTLPVIKHHENQRIARGTSVLVY